MLAAFITTVLFSVSAVSGNRTAKVLGGTEANFWRLVLATGLLAIYAHVLGQGLTGGAFPIFLVSGCVGFGVGDIALFQALPRIGSRLTVLLVLCLSAPVGGLIEWLWLGTALTTAEIAWGGTILAGVALALAPGKSQQFPHNHLVSGISFGLVASLCQAGGAVLSRKAFSVAVLGGENIDGMTAAYQRIVGGVLVAALSVLVVKRRELGRALVVDPSELMLIPAERISQWARVYPWLIANAVSGSVLGVSCFQWALKTTPSAVVLPIVALTPIVIIPFSRYLEGERPTRRSLIGGVIAVTGAVALALSR
jgi:drug/metabolite transporter (DMT)-like permease